MKVIVAGFSKTGTKTLNSALKILGYNVYDYSESLTYLRKEWAKILRDGWITEDFRKMYENVDAVTDIPACYFWEEIHKAFPEAKIILMVRDEEAWFKSFEKQLRTNEKIPLFTLMRLLSPTFRKAHYNVVNPLAIVAFGMNIPLWNPFGQQWLNKELLKMKYRAHNAHVLQNAPPDKLLVFKCSQGWEPLCEFLGDRVPDQPFPHKNKGGEVIYEAIETDPFLQALKKEVKISLGILAAASCFGGYLLYSRGPRGLFSSVTSALNSSIDSGWAFIASFGR